MRTVSLWRLSVKFTAIVITIFAANLFAAGQAVTPLLRDKSTVESVYLARDDGNGNPGEQVTSFSTTDIPIHCVVALGSPGQTVVKMIFVAVAVSGVRPDAKVVTTTYTTKTEEDQVNFTGKPKDKWSPGKYRVDIFVDGKLATNVAFEIRPASGSVDGAAFFQSKPKPRTVPPVRRNR